MKTGEITNNGIVHNSKGGTELMYERVLSDHAELIEERGINLICSRVRELDTSKKNILWLHDTAQDPEAQRLRDPEFRKQFAKLVFVSDYQFNTYRMMHGIQYSEAVVLKNAIDPLESSQSYDRNNQIRLIYHTTPHRGLELLYPAYEELYRKFGNRIHLDIYSSFSLYGWPERDELYRELFDKCQNHPGITYHGAVSNDEVRKALSRSHIFAYPNIWEETSCIAAMEAMSAGCMIVYPNHGALAETIANYSCCYQMHEDVNIHVNRFYGNLYYLIDTFWDIEQVNFRKNMTWMQRLHADTSYSWEKRKLEWHSFLSLI